MLLFVNARDERQALLALDVRCPRAPLATVPPASVPLCLTHVRPRLFSGLSRPPRAGPCGQLLDACVKNCGYPLHKQIGTKKFLNGLVRQFTERAPVAHSPPRGVVAVEPPFS